METSVRELAVINGMKRWCANPLVWGRDDCMLAVADVVVEITGKDPAVNWRGKYRSRQGAIKLMGERGGLGAMEDAAALVGWTPCEPAEAIVGDVGLVILGKNSKGRDIYAAVICRGSGYFIGRNENGFTALNVKRVVRAWHI